MILALLQDYREFPKQKLLFGPLAEMSSRKLEFSEWVDCNQCSHTVVTQKQTKVHAMEKTLQYVALCRPLGWKRI